MSEEIRRAAIAAVSKVFEKMFFVFAEEEEEAAPETDRKEERPLSAGSPVQWVWGEIAFQGDFPGNIRLTLPYGLALTMAANFMGLEEKEVSEPELLDVASELNNMIAGNLFSLLNKKAQYTLTKPRAELISEGEEEKRRSQESGLKIRFNVDGQRVDLNVHFPKPE